jgi:hypothetical protein
MIDAALDDVAKQVVGIFLDEMWEPFSRKGGPA